MINTGLDSAEAPGEISPVGRFHSGKRGRQRVRQVFRGKRGGFWSTERARMAWRGGCLALLGVCLTVLLPAARAQAGAQGGGARVLTTAGEIFGLPASEAAKELPVHLRATVAYYQPSRYMLFVSDATGGVYVNLIPSERPPMRRGDLIEVDGVTGKSYRTMVMNPHIRVIGKGTLPAAHEAGFRSLMAGEQDCQYVSIRGTVRSAAMKQDLTGMIAQLEVLIPGGLVRAYLQDDRGVDLAGLIDAEVQFSGVAGGVFNGRKQLMHTVVYASDQRELKVLRLARVKPMDLPWTAMGDVLQTRYVDDRSERVRVQGAVTFYEPANSIVIQHNGVSLLAQTHDSQLITLGEVVDVVGFAVANGSGPMLDEAQVFTTGRFEDVTPQKVSYEDAVAGKYSDGLVSLQGKVLSQLHDKLSDTMVIVVDDHPVNVLLWTGDRPRLHDLAMGTLVNVTGICHINKTDPWGSPVSFLLEVREPTDVGVVANASWWTVTHLLGLLLGLLAMSVSITAWAVALRRRVSAQAERIQYSMAVECQRGRLLEEINSSTPLPVLMDDICSSIGSLVPGVHCSYELLDSYYEEDRYGARGAIERGRTQQSGGIKRAALFEAVMTDTTGAALGIYRVIGPGERTLSEAERGALTVGASLSNLALNQRRLYERLNFHSTHDSLTGLPNRRYSDSRLTEVLRQAEARRERVGVVYIDVDHFKAVNDEFGHKTGDMYLQELSRRLSGAVRTRDLLARIGGDEFLLTVPGLGGLEDALAYKHRLESCFGDSFRLDDVTIHGAASIGMAIYPDHGETAEELQRHADGDMYEAKRRARTPPAPFAGMRSGERRKVS